MIKKRTFLLLALFGLVVGFDADATAGNPRENRSLTLNRVLGTPVRTWFNINNVSTQFTTDGISDIDASGNSGVVFPKGSRKTAVFCSGFLWGAYVPGDPQVRVGGSAYRTGLQGGKILSPGVPEDPDLPKNRIYRVRPTANPADFTADVTTEASEEGLSADAIRQQYILDWNEWPVGDGAPFEDKNANGTYEPAVDVPGVAGADQTVWFVANDLNSTLTSNLYGANPLGVEMQVTIWGYSQQGALGNMFFKKYLLINKSTTRFDSMYVSQWSDVDLGDASDDFGGCDTTRSLGYTYNANAVDATYGDTPPPAVGFDFFQGPLVNGDPADSAIFLGRRVYGKKNLPMTAFYYFARGDANVTDPTQGVIAGSTQFYRFFNGSVGLTGNPFVDPNTGLQTTFTLTGDPQTRSGWIDGQVLPAGDRRIGLASGPFVMQPGDTQEVVVAEVCAGAIPGTDRLSSIGLLKFYDDQAQVAYDNFFDLPIPPPAPDVKIAELDGQVVLQWGDNLTSVAATEGSNAKGFTFQGYNVYQLPSASSTIDDAIRIATFDVIDGFGKIRDKFFDTRTGEVLETVKQFGNDTGIRRSIAISTDATRGGTPLVNGIRYYFAVTAYNYNPTPNVTPNNLENPLVIRTIVPHAPNPGVRYSAAANSVVEVSHDAGVSDGVVTPVVVDPTRVTGKAYRVAFRNIPTTFYYGPDNNGDRDTVTTDIQHWYLISGTDTLYEGTNLGPNVPLNPGTHNLDPEVPPIFGDVYNYPIIEGIFFEVAGSPNGMKDWAIPNGTRRWTFADADFGFEGFEHSIGWDDPAHYFGINPTQTVLPTDLKNVLIKLAEASSGTTGNPDAGGNPYGGWDENNPGSDPNFSYGYRYLRGAAGAAARPEFAPYIVNATGGYAYQDYKRGVPVSAWNVEANPPIRLAVGFLENNTATGLVDGKWWPPANGTGVNNNNHVRDWLFIFNRPYTDATPDAELQRDILNNGLPVMWWVGVNRRGGADFSAGDEFLILANHPVTENDSYSLTGPTVTYNAAAAKEDVGKINVFPNPYYGVNSEELNKYQRFVTFSHLPERATIRIFNLAGINVRTIQKLSGSQFERWDLANDSGLPVGSGLYIAYIDMPDLGTTKVLKVAIIQEQQVLDRF